MLKWFEAETNTSAFEIGESSNPNSKWVEPSVCNLELLDVSTGFFIKKTRSQKCHGSETDGERNYSISLSALV